MHKKLILLFLIFIGILLPCIIVSLSGFTLINDGVDWVLNALSNFSENHLYLGGHFSHRARKIVISLQILPVNFAYFLFKINSLKILTNIYAVSLIALPSLLCLYSAFLFYRAKKFYLSFIPALELIAVIYPIIEYGVNEANIAVFFYFILFQYLLLNLNLKFYDKFILLLLCIAIYYSHEAIVLYAPLLWITYFFYTNKNSKFLKFCFINTILAFIEMFIFAYTPFGPNILENNSFGSALSFLHPPLFWHDFNGLVINYHACYFFIFSFLFAIALFIKNLKFHISLNSAILIIFLFVSLEYYTYIFYLYKYMCIYFLLIFTMVLIILFKKQDYLKSLSKRCIPIIFLCLIINNVYFINLAKDYRAYNQRLLSAAEKGYFYYNENISYYTDLDFHKYLLNGHIEQISYSIIAINSKKNKNITKGIILGFNEKRHPIYYCDGHINVPGGALDIQPETKFWNLTNYKKYFINNCSW